MNVSWTMPSTWALSLGMLTAALCGCSIDYTIDNMSLGLPKIESVQPLLVEKNTLFTLTIRGENLGSTDAVYVGGRLCSNLTFTSNQEMSCSVHVSDTNSSLDISLRAKNFIVNSKNQFKQALVLGLDDLKTPSLGITRGMSTPYGVTKINGKLFFNNKGNCRINILNSPPTSNFPEFDGFLGPDQIDNNDCFFFSNNRRYTLGPSTDAHSDGTRFVVTDKDNNRVLIWNKVPKNSSIPADVILGQDDFSTNSANFPALSAASLNSPTTARFSGGKLIVADTQNNRVLIWNTIPTANNQPADVIIGQTDGTSNSANQGQPMTLGSLKTPEFADVIEGQLMIADGGNDRVLIFPDLPATTGASATTVLSADPGIVGLPNETSLDNPTSIAFANNHLYVSDYSNHRIMIWNGIPTSDHEAAQYVIGQANFTTKTSGTTQSKIYAPRRVSVYDGWIYVADTSNYRYLTFVEADLQTGMNASFVLGQPDFTQRLHRNPNSDLAQVNPTSVYSDGTRFVVSDYGKHRVLLWNSMPTSHNQSPDVVIGQSDITGALGGKANNRLTNPFDAIVVGNRLIVSDMANNRVLIWNTWPTAHGQVPNVVVGQGNLTSYSANRGNSQPSETSLQAPRGLYSDGTNLIISDTGNNRVLIFNQIPTAHGAAADVVVGQTSFTTKAAGLSSTELSGPQRAKVFAGKLVVADRGNERVLIYNSVPTLPNASADVVVGQASMNTKADFFDILTDFRIFRPIDFIFSNGVFKIITGEHRILRYNGLPTISGQVPLFDFGNSPLGTITVLGVGGIQGAFGYSMTPDGDELIADYGNNRSLILPP